MKAFVAMPFAANFDKYWTAISEVCNSQNIGLFRVDKNLSFERHIDIAIRREIREADFMIALLTGDCHKEIPNPNVAFEVGYAQGHGMETILLAEEIEHLPFDFQQQRCCLYHGDMNKFREGLRQEVILLKKMLETADSENTKIFFKELTRCLRIVLPPEYRLFKEEKGYFEETIWYAIYFGKQKRDFRYSVAVDAHGRISLACWLANEEIRRQQKEFFKDHYDFLCKHLGYDIDIRFKEGGISSRRMDQRNRELVKEAIETNKKMDIKEVLQIALRLKVYIEAFEPLNRQFFTSLAEKEQITSD